MLRFQLLRRITQGGTGQVCQCLDRINDTAVAIKVMPDASKACGEIHRLKSLGHPNVIEVLDCFESDGYVAIVMPLVTMTLSAFAYEISYRSDTMVSVMVQITRGVHHMHVRGILHLDIKPTNIGVVYIQCVEDVQCKILDLGSAICVDRIQSGDTFLTTPEFRAPEMCAGAISSASDIYSMGRVFEVLMCGASSSVSKSSSQGMAEIRGLASNMLAPHPRDRPTSKRVLACLGETDNLVLVQGAFWNSIVANLTDGDLSFFINDSSNRLHKLVSLVRSDSVECIENAFWLLQEEARREMARRPVLSVISVLPYFHSRLHISRLACFFYARALAYLSHLPFFMLSDDMKLHLWRISSQPACERMVLRILARAYTTELLAWCSDAGLLWGSHQQLFVEFVRRFVIMGSRSMCQAEAACLAAAVRV